MIVPEVTFGELGEDPSILSRLSLIGDVLLTGNVDELPVAVLQTASCILDLSNDNDTRNVTQLLDNGARKVILPAFSGDEGESRRSAIEGLPAERLLVALPAGAKDVTVLEIIESWKTATSGYLWEVDATPGLDEALIVEKAKQIRQSIGDGNLLVRVVGGRLSVSLIRRLHECNIDLVAPASRLSFDLGDSTKLNVGEAFSSVLTSDRSDGLFPTVVVDEQRVALGLCYSSVESISHALRTGQGVYQSRTRGLWYKGASSGATQKLLKISYDCDEDALQFIVRQADPGFCHRNTRTCFGPDSGISHLAATLRSRKTTAPGGSYTRRLFEDHDLLHSKIMEEAEELCDAKSAEDIAWETADLIYFALVKCTAAGVSLADIETQLDRRARKVSRRPGNAKPKWNMSGKASNGSPVPKQTSAGQDEINGLREPISPRNGTPVEDEKKEIKMKTYNISETTPEQRRSLLLRPIIKTEEIIARVRPIMADVRQRGDEAIFDLTERFDGVKLSSTVLKAPFPSTAMLLPQNVRQAIDQAYENIRRFHEAQLDRSVLQVETMPGVVCTRFFRPIERVGLYVPGGTAVLPSSTLMLGVPAKVAGCSEIVIATPPRKDGSVAPEVIYVAHKIGASTVVVAGGAQAVAAMAYGTASVPKVDKICGPGNQYVTAAKMIAQSDSSAMVSIDMPAGPSELLVIADSSCNPAYVASDLLSQAEHGADSQVVLIAVGLADADVAAIEREVKTQGEALPRAAIVRESIPKSYILRVDTMEQAMDFSNRYAPEHLILHLEEAENWVDQVQNAGSVFVGPYSPESCGDYASGTNHTLPTYGYARMYSGVNTLTFVKHITSQMLTREGLDRLGDTVTTLAEVEGLEAHRNAVAIRLKDIRAGRE
ncbi:hypothetical protein SpCBS45565_g01988 [Spizellomyces sp. 'palustris']|nr:hypothetical protein SpCBS45565_g01988 [Spizellomyces sp. 'palustris']